MHTQTEGSRRFHLYISDLDNHVQVETKAGNVVISATRNNFSEGRKMSFVRYLSAEGYIPDHYKCLTEQGGSGSSRVQWIVRRPCLQSKSWLGIIRQRCTLRHAVLGFLIVVWLLCFDWARRHALPFLAL